MSRKLISTGSTFETQAGYSRAVVQGDWCFVSGTTGYDYETMEMPDCIADQTRNCLQTIASSLSEAGFCEKNIVRVNYTLVDRNDFEVVVGVVGQFFKDIRPAATMIIADLVRLEMKIEIEVTAYKGG